jgi:membrane protein implicated in regulation of membrane protease activity
MEIIYLVAFFLGLGFAVLSGLLSDVFHAHSPAMGDIDLSHAPGDMDLGAHHGGGHHGGMHFPLLSPVTISTFIASFGGTGIILLKLKPEWGYAIQIPGAIGAALAVTGMVGYLFYKVFGNVQVSSAPREIELIGLEAEVTVSIPKDGMGQIGYLSHGTRFTSPAKSSDKVDLKTGDKVKIIRIDGNVYYVSKIQ